MVPAEMNEFFAATAGVAGALIGLLFVAISVTGNRLTLPNASAQVHRIRANAALTSFSNSLVVSLFALIPGEKIGYTAAIFAVVGLVFVVAALLSLLRLQKFEWTVLRDALFIVGLAVVFISQLISGLDVINHPHAVSSVYTIAILLVVCFTIGVARAWELIGGPSIGLRQEFIAIARHEELLPDTAEAAREEAETARETEVGGTGTAGGTPPA